MDKVEAIQRLLDAIDRNRLDWQREQGAMTLGEILDDLETRPQDYRLGVQWVHGVSGIGEVDSYRGYYKDLAIEPGPVTSLVEVGLGVLRQAVGSTVEGYKGGEFLITRESRVWVSTCGDCSGLMVTGVEQDDEEHTIILRTTKDASPSY